jgi:hypothetical protein
MENDDVTVLLVWNGPGVGKKWQLDGVLRSLKRERGEDSSDEEAVVVKEKRIGKIKPEKIK